MREKIERALQRWLDAALARIDGRLDNVSLRSKLYSIFVFCVLCPLVLTDSIVMWMLYDTEHKSRQQTMENTAEAVAYELNTTIDAAVDLAQMIYQNRYINEFLQGSYPTPLDYYIAYNDLMEESLYEVVMGNSAYQTVIYADNPDFINGGYFARLSSVQGESWYQEFNDSGRSSMVTTYYYSKEAIGYRTRKTISVIRRMDYERAGSRDILKLDLDYAGMSRALDNARYANTVYVCVGNRILLSNDGRGGINTPFEALTSEIRKQAGVRRPLPLKGTSWDVYVMPEPIELLGVIRRNLALLALLLAANIWLPLLFMRLINRSFTQRLQLLSDVFKHQNTDRLEPIARVRGYDEIGALMRSYNHMAERINGLIQTVYKDKLKQQEMDIARQTAELLALHSQINPHFLFNALESIRMHSILKKEYETADMVEKLALMQRQNVEWSSDDVTVEGELQFVRAYLELQKYRFGDRLSYEIEAEEDCRGLHIPRLSLVTFVENACVHGIEKKSAPGWIFVRVFLQGGTLCLEVEDTGIGMPEEDAQAMRRRMNEAEISQLRKKGRVGILNACIRLKMATGDRVRFELESEENVGTTVTVLLPAEGLEKGDIHAESNARG